MNILIVNDDGIGSVGLQVLADRLSYGNNVFVMAPDSNRSGVSNCITMFHSSNILKKYNNNQWCCSGCPADCVRVGLESDLFGVKFDVVISGINKGANLGTDIIYSGTCAGAREAVLCGVPGIALSIEPVGFKRSETEEYKYNAIADFTANNLKTLADLAYTKEPRMFVNINGASVDMYKGAKIGKFLCLRNYNSSVKIEKGNDYLISDLFLGEIRAEYEQDSDVQIVQSGYICVNQIYADPVCNSVVDGISFKL